MDWASGPPWLRKYPTTRAQRCRVHKTASVLDKFPKTPPPPAKDKIHPSYLAPTQAAALIFQKAVGWVARGGKGLLEWVMPLPIAPLAAHPRGEGLEPRAAAARAVASRPLAVDTHGWRPAPHGYEGAEGQLQLSGWTARRRVLVRRPWRERPAPEPAPDAAPALPWSALVVCGPAPEYEYQVLVTNLTEELLTVADLYRPRADAENVCDELKNQWGSRRLHHAGSAALPGGRAERGAGLQLVEPVRAPRPSDRAKP